MMNKKTVKKKQKHKAYVKAKNIKKYLPKVAVNIVEREDEHGNKFIKTIRMTRPAYKALKKYEDEKKKHEPKEKATKAAPEGNPEIKS